MDFFECLTLDNAQQIIYDELKDYKVDNHIVPLMESLGNIAAEDIYSKADLPSFSRSTVDGFAVRGMDTFGASESTPAMLKIIGEVKMGEGTDLVVSPGEAVHIPTGGMLPEGADTAVMIEYTEQMDEETLLVQHVSAPGEHIISKGEDVSSGQLILKAGSKIGSRQIALLASNGVGKVCVRRKLRVAVLSTGNELVEVGTELQDGQIWNSNSYALAALIEESGYTAVRYGIVKDTLESFVEAISKAARECNAIVISGGSSVGVRDFSVKAIEHLGKPGILFHGIMIRPGKPSIFGKIENTPVFGLPGHPLAAITVLEALALPAFALMSGEETSYKVVLNAKLMRNIASVPNRDDFVYTELLWKDGEYQAFPILGKSGIIRLFSDADGMIRIPANKTGLKEGETVEVFNVHRITRERK